MRRSLDILELRSDIHTHDTGNKGKFDVPMVRLKRPQYNFKTLFLDMYDIFSCKVWELPKINFTD